MILPDDQSYARKPPKRIAGARVLDFVNTVEWRTGAAQERLTGFEEVVAWSAATGLLDTAACKALRRAAGTRPRAARAALRRLLRFRDALFAIVAQPEDRNALDALNGMLARQAPVWEVADRGTRAVQRPPADPLDLPLSRLLAELLALLRDGPPGAFKLCGNPGCGWIFMDVSRRRDRRWCDMATCGNRAKTRSHYARLRRSQA